MSETVENFAEKLVEAHNAKEKAMNALVLAENQESAASDYRNREEGYLMPYLVDAVRDAEKKVTGAPLLAPGLPNRRKLQAMRNKAMRYKARRLAKAVKQHEEALVVAKHARAAYQAVCDAVTYLELKMDEVQKVAEKGAE